MAYILWLISATSFCFSTCQLIIETQSPPGFHQEQRTHPQRAFVSSSLLMFGKSQERVTVARKPRPPTYSRLLAPSPSAVPHRFPLEVQFTFHYCAELLGSKNLQLLFLSFFAWLNPKKRISSQEGLPLDRSLSVQKADMVIKTFFFCKYISTFSQIS